MAKAKASSKKPTRQSKKKSPKSSPGFLRSVFQRKGALVLVALIAFASVGTWQLTKSSAITYDLSGPQCYIRGRDGYQATKYAYRCEDTCRNDAGSPIKKEGRYLYCSGAISPGISKDKCVNILRRHYVGDVGCARRWTQVEAKSATQCIHVDQIYHVADPFDYCGSPPASGGSSGGAWIWPTTPNTGVGGFGSGHYARDFDGVQGTTIRAVQDGTVVWKGQISSACGNGLILRTTRPSGGTTYAVYEHMSYSNTSSGAVSQGTTLGWMAAPPSPGGGCWYGYHVHLGVQTHGGYIESHRSSYHADPCDYVSGC